MTESSQESCQISRLAHVSILASDSKENYKHVREGYKFFQKSSQITS